MNKVSDCCKAEVVTCIDNIGFHECACWKCYDSPCGLVNPEGRDEETPTAQLRNLLSPHYGLSDLVLFVFPTKEASHPEFENLMVRQAKEADKNKLAIIDKLKEIDDYAADAVQKEREAIIEIVEADIQEWQFELDNNPKVNIEGTRIEIALAHYFINLIKKRATDESKG